MAAEKRPPGSERGMAEALRDLLRDAYGAAGTIKTSRSSATLKTVMADGAEFMIAITMTRPGVPEQAPE